MLIKVTLIIRGIAQSGSALALGARCREFESLYPDQLFSRTLLNHNTFPMSLFDNEYSLVFEIAIDSAPVAHLDRASAF